MNLNIRAWRGRLPADDSTLICSFRNHLSLAVVLTMVAVPICAQDVVPGTNGQIAFNRGAAFEGGTIWLMNPDGSGQTQLTKNEINAAVPRWSPDGTRIAFERYNNQLISQIY